MNSFKVCIFIIIAITLGYFGYLYYPQLQDFIIADKTSETEITARPDFNDSNLYGEFLKKIDATEKLGGYILLTSALKSTSSEEPWDSFVYDLQQNIIRPVNSEETYYFLSKSKNENKYLYSGRPWKTDSERGIYNDSVILTDLGTGSVLKTIENPKGSYFTRIRLPRWSSNGSDYLYSAQIWENEVDKPEVGDIDSWKISVGSTKSMATSTHFVNGYGAQWIGSGKYIAYVKSKGIYVKKYNSNVDHSKETEFRIISDIPAYSPRNHIAVSPDGEYIAVQHVFLNQQLSNASIDVYKFSETDTGPKADLVKRIAFKGAESVFWPQFSPGGRYLSFQTSNFLLDSQEKTSIQMYDFVTEKVVQSFDFNDYKFDSSFNTDWVKSIQF